MFSKAKKNIPRITFNVDKPITRTSSYPSTLNEIDRSMPNMEAQTQGKKRTNSLNDIARFSRNYELYLEVLRTSNAKGRITWDQYIRILSTDLKNISITKMITERMQSKNWISQPSASDSPQKSQWTGLKTEKRSWKKKSKSNWHRKPENPAVTPEVNLELKETCRKLMAHQHLKKRAKGKSKHKGKGSKHWSWKRYTEGDPGPMKPTLTSGEIPENQSPQAAGTLESPSKEWTRYVSYHYEEAPQDTTTSRSVKLVAPYLAGWKPMAPAPQRTRVPAKSVTFNFEDLPLDTRSRRPAPQRHTVFTNSSTDKEFLDADLDAF